MSSATRMPVVFIGHGSPMNAVEDNDFTRTLTGLGGRLPRPKAILCISAHWMTEGTWITHMDRPRTIHDFYGFPPALFEIQYSAPSDPRLAEQIQSQMERSKINLDHEMWGFDHGAWSVLRHLYPAADVPVLQLSLHMEKPPDYHFDLGRQLRTLRDQGVLILGSGNIVHNLRLIRWEQDAQPYDWAVEFDEWVKSKLQSRDFDALIAEATQSRAGQLAIPTPEHWYPLLYVLGAVHDADALRFEYTGLHNASISMRCVSFGPTG